MISEKFCILLHLDSSTCTYLSIINLNLQLKTIPNFKNPFVITWSLISCLFTQIPLTKSTIYMHTTTTNCPFCQLSAAAAVPCIHVHLKRCRELKFTHGWFSSFDDIYETAFKRLAHDRTNIPQLLFHLQ